MKIILYISSIIGVLSGIILLLQVIISLNLNLNLLGFIKGLCASAAVVYYTLSIKELLKM